MRVELAVFDRLERGGQQRRHLVGRHDDPVLAMDREDAADQQRIEAHDGDLAALRVLEARDRVAAEPEAQRAGVLAFVREAKIAHEHADLVAAPAIGARPIGVRDREIAEPLEFLREAPRRQLLAGVELDRLRVDPGGQRPAPPLELRGDAPVEHGHDHDCHEQQQQREHGKAALQAPAHALRQPFLACHGSA